MVVNLIIYCSRLKINQHEKLWLGRLPWQMNHKETDIDPLVDLRDLFDTITILREESHPKEIIIL